MRSLCTSTLIAQPDVKKSWLQKQRCATAHHLLNSSEDFLQDGDTVSAVLVCCERRLHHVLYQVDVGLHTTLLTSTSQPSKLQPPVLACQLVPFQQ
jgi:hypothetical protein